MRRPPSFPARLLAAVLAAGIPASALGQTLSAPLARSAASPAPMTGAAAIIPASFLNSLSVQLSQTALRLQTDLPAAGGVVLQTDAAGTQDAALPSVPRLDAGPAAAEYLARQALSGPAVSALSSEDAQAAAALSRALADPEARQALTGALRRSGWEQGEVLAAQLDQVARAARGNPYLSQLASDLSAAPIQGDALAAIFDGTARRPAELTTPEEFVSYAARRFMAGRLLPGGKAGVAYSQSVPDDQEMHDEMALSPLTNAEREKVVAELFRQAGAKPEEIVLQDAGGGTRNVYVVKKGRTDRTIVIGAHHDKADVGHGTIDNWTGATMVPNLYQALRDVETEATLVFAVFAREEEGLLGSREFIRRLSNAQRSEIDSMVNLDTLAVDGTYSWKNNSDKPLLERIKAVAKKALLALTEVVFWGGDADSSSFRRAGIPAMTVFGASEAVIWDIIHSENDTMAVFSLPHYKNAYQLVLELLKSLDVSPIGRVSRWAMRLAYPSGPGLINPV